MKRLLVTIALGATIFSTQALAQDAGAPGAAGAGGPGGGGRAQRDTTRAQALQMADRMFDRFDLNHDGTVTRQEAEQARAQLGFGSERVEKMIARTFGDAQSLTRQQFEAQALARFDRDDLNHDGVVTAAERRQARAQLKAERGQAPQ